MKTKDYNEYSFEELYQAATAPDAQQIDVDTLGEWADRFGDCWNGECYDVSHPHLEPSGSRELWPIYRIHLDEDGEIGEVEIVGYRWSQSEAAALREEIPAD